MVKVSNSSRVDFEAFFKKKKKNLVTYFNFVPFPFCQLVLLFSILSIFYIFLSHERSEIDFQDGKDKYTKIVLLLKQFQKLGNNKTKYFEMYKRQIYI